MKKYRLKNKKYRKPAEEIAGFVTGGSLPLEYYVSLERSDMRKRLEEYGVFDLWFEEVQEPEFKPGDYIYILNTGNMYEIGECEVKGDELHWNVVGGCRGSWHYSYCTYLSNIRHATAEEIQKHKQQLPTINGYKGKRNGDFIVYGCQKIHIEDFRRLYRACLDTNVTSITIAGQEVPMETLQEIYEKTY